jgi:xylose isomerase
MSSIKCALITGFVGKTRDRFSEYNQDKTLEQKLELVSKIPDMKGVECVFPYETGPAETFKALVAKNKLGIAAINVNVKAEPEFRSGGLTSHDPEVRKKAVRFIKEAKDYAVAVGADKVTCCPLSDGYEFAFQYDYRTMWKYLVETFSEAGSYRPEIPLFIEYKPSETRGRCFLDTAARTLLLINDTGVKNMGVTIDYGHSKYGGENPAETLCLLAGSGKPIYIHINDNNGRWDWDYMAASNNFLDYVEFMYYVREIGYKDYLTTDASPTRWDIPGFFEANNRITHKIWNLLGSLDQNELRKLLGSSDYLQTWRFIEQKIFKL